MNDGQECCLYVRLGRLMITAGLSDEEYRPALMSSFEEKTENGVMRRDLFVDLSWYVRRFDNGQVSRMLSLVLRPFFVEFAYQSPAPT